MWGGVEPPVFFRSTVRQSLTARMAAKPQLTNGLILSLALLRLCLPIPRLRVFYFRGSAAAQCGKALPFRPSGHPIIGGSASARYLACSKTNPLLSSYSNFGPAFLSWAMHIISRDSPCYLLTSVAKNRLPVFQTKQVRGRGPTVREGFLVSGQRPDRQGGLSCFGAEARPSGRAF